MRHAPDLHSAGTLLSAAWQCQVRLRLQEAIVEEPGYRHRLLRCRVDSDRATLPATVILKAANPLASIATELTALRFLGSLPRAARIVPALYAGNLSANLILMEDLGDGPRLRERLRGSDPEAAEEALLAMMDQLGTLHAATVGREREYEKLHDEVGREPGFAHTVRLLAEECARFGERSREAGVAPAPHLAEEASQVATEVTDGGPFRTFTSGDPAPVNVIPRDGSVRLLDFEVSGYRSALVDGCFPWMRHLATTDANRFPPPLARQMEQRYRTALAAGIPAALDDARYNPALVAAAAAWLSSTLRYLPKALIRDRTIGLATRRQRILGTLDAFLTLSEARGLPLPGYHESAARLRPHLDTLWSANLPPLPLYPAFR